MKNTIEILSLPPTALVDAELARSAGGVAPYAPPRPPAAPSYVEKMNAPTPPPGWKETSLPGINNRPTAWSERKGVVKEAWQYRKDLKQWEQDANAYDARYFGWPTT